MNLFIDAGNTKIKFMLDKKIFEILTQKKIKAEELYEQINDFIANKNIDGVVVSSVVSKLNKTIEIFAEKYLQSKVTFINFKNTSWITTSVKNGDSLGADIIANAVYASELHKDVIIVSLGTATVISKIIDKEICGVIISPGLYSSYKNLVDSTDLSSDGLIDFKNLAGQTTEESISIGVIKGQLHMINGFLNELKNNKKTYIFVTGGDSQKIAKYLNAEFVNNMVLKGLDIFINK